MELGCAVPVMLSEYALLWLCIKVLQVFFLRKNLGGVFFVLLKKFRVFFSKLCGFRRVSAEPAEFRGMLACFMLVVWLLCFVALNFSVWCYDSYFLLLLCARLCMLACFTF